MPDVVRTGYDFADTRHQWFEKYERTQDLPKKFHKTITGLTKIYNWLTGGKLVLTMLEDLYPERSEAFALYTKGNLPFDFIWTPTLPQT